MLVLANLKLDHLALSFLVSGITLILLVPYAISSETVFPYVVSRTSVAQAGAALCLLGFALTSTKQWNLSFLLLCGFFYLAILLVTALFGSDISRSLFSTFERGQGVVTTTIWFLFAISTAQILKKESSWQRLYVAVSCSAYVYSLLATLHYLDILIIDNLYQDGDRLSYTIGNASLLGAYLASVVPVSSVLLMREIRRGELSAGALLHAAGLLLTLNTLVSTGSRGAAIAVIAWVLFLLWQLPKKYWISAAIFIVSLSAVSIVANIDLLADRLADTTLSNVAIAGRLDAWIIGLRAFMAMPITGWGPDNYLIAFGHLALPAEAGAESFDHAHSHLIDILATSGLLGLTAYVLLAAAMLNMIYKAWDDEAQVTHDNLLITVGIVITYQVSALFLFETAVNQSLFFIALAYCLSIAPNILPLPLQKTARLTAATLVVGILWFATLSWTEAARLQRLTSKTWKDPEAMIYSAFRTEEKVIAVSENVWRDWRNLSTTEKETVLALLVKLGAGEPEQFTWRGISKLGYAWLRISVDYPAFSQQLVSVANRLQLVAPKRWETAEFMAYYYLAQRQNERALSVLQAYLDRDPTHPRLTRLAEHLKATQH